jgi:hypothetical protein
VDRGKRTKRNTGTAYGGRDRRRIASAGSQDHDMCGVTNHQRIERNERVIEKDEILVWSVRIDRRFCPAAAAQ